MIYTQVYRKQWDNNDILANKHEPLASQLIQTFPPARESWQVQKVNIRFRELCSCSKKYSKNIKNIIINMEKKFQSNKKLTLTYKIMDFKAG